MKIILIFFIFVAVAARVDAKKRCYPLPACGQNEVYSDCGANSCQLTCEKQNNGNFCTAECKAGCICENNYVRDSNGKCVLVKDCPPLLTCLQNEYYHPCSTYCEEPTCGNRNGTICGVECQPKCLCMEGFVRSVNTVCINATMCNGSFSWSYM
ncbi:hypothetical protein ACKWTF_000705 [Chironomus riparius]